MTGTEATASNEREGRGRRGGYVRIKEMECIVTKEMWDELGIVFPWLFTEPIPADDPAAHVCLREVSAKGNKA